MQTATRPEAAAPSESHAPSLRTERLSCLLYTSDAADE